MSKTPKSVKNETIESITPTSTGRPSKGKPGKGTETPNETPGGSKPYELVECPQCQWELYRKDHAEHLKTDCDQEKKDDFGLSKIKDKSTLKTCSIVTIRKGKYFAQCIVYLTFFSK